MNTEDPTTRPTTLKSYTPRLVTTCIPTLVGKGANWGQGHGFNYSIHYSGYKRKSLQCWSSRCLKHAVINHAPEAAQAKRLPTKWFLNMRFFYAIRTMASGVTYSDLMFPQTTMFDLSHWFSVPFWSFSTWFWHCEQRGQNSRSVINELQQTRLLIHSLPL